MLVELKHSKVPNGNLIPLRQLVTCQGREAVGQRLREKFLPFTQFWAHRCSIEYNYKICKIHGKAINEIIFLVKFVKFQI